LVKRYSSNDLNGEVWRGEAVDFLRQLEPESASIVFLDPPFNLGKAYSADRPNLDHRPEPEYRNWLEEVLAEASRVLTTGGALYLYHLPIWAMRLGTVLEPALTFRHWIAVSMKNGFVRGRRLYPAHYALLFFTKGVPLSFSRPRLKPQTCRHCGGLVKDYGGYRGIIEEKGINLSDIWDDFSPVRHTNRKFRDANELQPGFFDRLLAISGSAGQLYVDPFAGAGAGLLAAARAGMRFQGCDLLAKNCRVISERLNGFRSLQ
jgi:site-specific DNA-methyltransferase (adenine-specific)